jgi:hypothetical protein
MLYGLFGPVIAIGGVFVSSCRIRIIPKVRISFPYFRFGIVVLILRAAIMRLFFLFMAVIRI